KMKNLWKNDEYAKKTKIGQKKAYLRNKENIDKRNREMAAKRWLNLDYRKRMIEIAAKRWLNFDYRKRMSDIAKVRGQSKENIERLTKMTRSPEGRKRSSTKMKTRWLDPAWRKINADLWADPEFRKKNARGIAKAARDGSKLEKYALQYISKALVGIEIKFKDWGLLKNQEVDILIPSLKVAIEVQGYAHFYPIYGQKKFEQRQKGDNRKRERLEQLGWKLLYINAAYAIKLSQIEYQCDAVIHELPGFENWKPPQKKL
ncbi:MAG: hypothetical protein NTV88_00910, partial [Candidatus Micrarchaeota archaeon]|nr:hypothetical protein [Candidatus Micrarchaeota archaeon]